MNFIIIFRHGLTTLYVKDGVWSSWSIHINGLLLFIDIMFVVLIYSAAI